MTKLKVKSITNNELLLNGSLTPVSGLDPMDEVAPIAAQLERTSKVLMPVGHLPFMERLASFLLTEDFDQPLFRFTNAAIVCLTRAEKRWQISWILTPQIASNI